MAWRPLVTDVSVRAAVTELASELAAVGSGASGETIDASCDLAVLQAYFGEAATRALEASVERLARHGGSPGLFGGASRVGWTIAHVADEEAIAEVCTPIDATLTAMLADEPRSGEYDLISGLVGIGVYALERGEAGAPLVQRVLEQLATLARSRHGGLAWFTPPALLPPQQRERAPNGYWNLGLAHGAAGVVALCARCMAANVAADRAGSLLEPAVQHLIAAGPRYTAWQAGGQPDLPPSSRLAWCYNDLGVAVALVAAAGVDAGWRPFALELARDCARRSDEAAQVVEHGICHGTAGVAHIFHRISVATGDELVAAAARHWLDRLLAMRHEFPRDDPSLLTGIAGIALVLHAAIADDEPRWDRLLLLS